MYYFAAAQQTSTAKLAEIIQNFQETERSLKVSETTFIWRNAFFDNLFQLQSERESINYKRTFFYDYPWIVNLPVNP